MGNKACKTDDGEQLSKKIDEGDVDTIGVLKGIPVISSLSKSEQVTLASKLAKKTFNKGDYLMKYGESGKEFFLILEGTCAVLASDGSKVAELSKSDFCGEMALLESKPRNASIQCLTEVHTLVCDKTTFETVLGENSKVKFQKRTAKRQAVLTVNVDEDDFKADANALKKSAKTVKWLKQCIGGNMMFSELDDAQKTAVVSKMYMEKIPKGTELIKQGDTSAQTFYVIESGTFSILVNGEEVTRYTAGMTFGELALMYDTERAATVKAVDGCTVWTMRRQAFRLAVRGLVKDANKERMRWLGNVKLFKPLKRSELSNINSALEERAYKKGDVIIKEGDPGADFHLVKTGKVEWRTKKGEHGQIGVGDYFGERALIKNQPRASTCTAKQDCVCLELSKANFSNLLGNVAAQMRARIEAEQEFTMDFLKREETAKKMSKKKPRGSALLQGLCKLDELKTVGVLGKGAFGTVTLVVDPKTKKSYALKAIKKCQIAELGQQDHIVNEKVVMGMMNNDFLVNLRGTYKDKLRVYFLLDVCLGGELFTILRKRRYFDEDTSRFYSSCVIEAFDYMHSENIIYRDLKPENLVLDTKGYLKVTDFGFAKKIDDKTYTLCGTPDYLAPEIVTGQGHGKGVDWWTLGILIYEMLASFPPFFDDQAIETYRKIVKGKVKFPRYFSVPSKDLIKAFLKNKPTKRLGVLHNGDIDKIREHQWFNGYKWEDLRTMKTMPPIIPRVKNNADISNFNKMKLERDDAKPIRASQEFDMTF